MLKIDRPIPKPIQLYGPALAPFKNDPVSSKWARSPCQ